MNTKIKKIIYDMRTQPVIGWVTLIGTALSIFLIMIIVMMQQVSVLSFKPETHRDRMLYGMYFHTTSIGNERSGSSSALSYKRAKSIYDNLDGVEETSYTSSYLEPTDAKGTSERNYTLDLRLTDDAFWRIFDFDLIAGRYFTPEEIAAQRAVAVITESAARRLFNSADVVGRHFDLDHNDHEVIGVVGDVSKLASMAYGEVFAPVSFDSWDDNFGDLMACMLVKPGIDFERIRAQVRQRYAQVDSELAADGRKSVYHEAPFDQETIASGVGGSNTTPDPSAGKATRYLIYIILLLVPAINLSSMLHSRLRRRINEIGVQRAFGCTRRRIFTDIISESLIVTLVGGIIGLLAAVAFTLSYGGLLSDFGDAAVSPSLSMLLHPQTFILAFAACFILNLLSSAVPALQAGRLNPVEALNAK